MKTRRTSINNYKVKLRLINERGNICNKCKERFDYLELDHIIPLWANGNHNDNNLQLLCMKCHGKKTAKETRVRNKIYPQKIISDGVWINKSKCINASKLSYFDFIEVING